MFVIILKREMKDSYLNTY